MKRADLRHIVSRDARRCRYFLIALVCGVVPCSAGVQQDTPRAQAPSRIAEAVRVDHSPRLDGTLNDPLWQLAKPIADFLQQEPFEGQRPSERTVVRIVYTQKEIYFGIECDDSDPKGIVASELRRDVPLDDNPPVFDDYFEILIDPTDDKRNGYVFQVNPLGTQLDGTVTEESQNVDTGWDGVWSSSARITQSGWTATIGIPFTTLNFSHSRNVTWGVNFLRFIRRKNETDLWAAWQRAFGITKISQEGELMGIRDIGSGRLFFIRPYGLLGSDRLSGQGGTQALATGGVDVKYGIRSSLVANFTVNTDFGEADVDQQQFNLTPYKLFFPETRQFFLENADVFSFPTGQQDLLFFSRQIGIDPNTGLTVPIDVGGKVTGSLGKYEVGVMDVLTRATGQSPYDNYSVARVKRSLFGSSYVGLLGIDKESGNPLDRYNRAGGADTRLVLHKNFVLHAYAVGTNSPGTSSGNSNVGADISYVNDWMQLFAMRNKIGPNYNPEVGFVNRADVNESFLDLNLAPRPKIPGIRELNFEGFIDHAPFANGRFQAQEWQGTFRAMWNNGAYTDDDLVHVYTQLITSPFNIYKNIFIPPGIYHFDRHQFTYGSPENRQFTINLNDTFGGYYGGTLNYLHVGTNYRPSQRYSMTTSAIWNRFRLPEGNFSVVLAALGGNYSFSRFLTTSALLQMDTANTQAMSANLRLRWQYRHDDPYSDLFVIYNVGTRFASLSGSNLQQLRETRFEVKFTYSISFPHRNSHRSAASGE